MLKLLKTKTGEPVRQESEPGLESETRSFYTKSVRINSIQNDDPCTSRNTNCCYKNSVFWTFHLFCQIQFPFFLNLSIPIITDRKLEFKRDIFRNERND